MKHVQKADLFCLKSLFCTFLGFIQIKLGCDNWLSHVPLWLLTGTLAKKWLYTGTNTNYRLNSQLVNS